VLLDESTNASTAQRNATLYTSDLLRNRIYEYADCANFLNLQLTDWKVPLEDPNDFVQFLNLYSPVQRMEQPCQCENCTGGDNANDYEDYANDY
jgi:hypothetical protein